jgi:hypothetical protein
MKPFLRCSVDASSSKEFQFSKEVQLPKSFKTEAWAKNKIYLKVTARMSSFKGTNEPIASFAKTSFVLLRCSCPVPIVRPTDDWNLFWHSRHFCLPHCDIVPLDSFGVEVLAQVGHHHVRLTNIRGLG